MTIGSISRIDYVGNGAVDTYSYTFKVFDQDDLLVTVKDTDDVETILTITTDYTVTGVGETAGGTIVLVNSSQAWLDAGGDLLTDYTLTIRRVLDIVQETDIRNQGSYYPEGIEKQFDKCAMIDQQQQDELDRSIKIPESSDPATFDLVLPDFNGQAGKAIVVKTSEDGLELSSTITGATNSATVDNRILRSDGVAGNIQQTGITVDDSDNVTGIKINADGSGNSITNIENADIKAAAAIAVNKLAALTASKIMVTDSSGFASTSSIASSLLVESALGVNYCTNGGAEIDTSGWVTYSDTPASTPANGIGGVPVVTWTRSTSSPLRGTASFLLTKDAANRQGEGVSFDFTPAVADQEGLVQVSFEYSCSANYADSDISVHVYDVTGSALEVIYGISSGLEDTSASDYRQVTFNFVLNANCVASRLIFHVASTNASAYTVQFDNVQIRPVYSDGVEVEVIVDTKAANTAGGTFTSGAARTRTLSSTTLNARPWCSVVSDQFTLIAGRYLIRAEVPAYKVDRHKAYLYSITDAALASTGSSEFSANAAAYASTNSIITVEISITSSKTYEIRHWCETTSATSGFGVANNLNSMAEIYTRVTILRLGAPYTQWT